MKFSIFTSAKAQKGVECTYEAFLQASTYKGVYDICNKIARCQDKDERANLKKMLPVITWQALFEGKRLNAEARPSGLFMLDIDHVEKPAEVYKNQIAGKIRECGIVFVSLTASQHGLRVVAKCRPELHTLVDCQKWLSEKLGVEFDPACKDFARCSFVVPDSYHYYLDCKAIWEDEPEKGTLYAAGKNPVQENAEMEKALTEATETAKTPANQQEGLFGGITEHKGIKLEVISKEWLRMTGGEPEEGERNTRLHKLAMRMRYITDFNEATLLRVMPNYGLGETEMKELIHSACSMPRAGDMPKDLRSTIAALIKRKNLGDNYEEDDIPEIITSTEKMPSLPPLLKQWCEIAPPDFKAPVVLASLPVLGALGSRLRGVYLDGKKHSPSFQVSLEAPQASGKSFLGKLVETDLALMMQHDELEREKERVYAEKAAEMKMLNIKVTVENKDEILGTKPKSIIRYVPPTISITKLLQRMNNAGGLHLFAFAPEIDTIYKAFKRGLSSFSDALRVSFDNDLYGQDYASDNSFSGVIPLYYNCLFSGTPKAMRRFYPDVEDGLVSRVLFISLEDQFGKPMPVWKNFTSEQKRIVDIQLERLNEITLQGDEIQPEHILKIDWLNAKMSEWLKAQQAFAVKEDDRTRDIFCRRSAVVGFRAGMIAFFLWGEHATPAITKNVCDFAIWVANNMLNQHLLRFNISESGSNTFRFGDVYDAMPDVFDYERMQGVLDAMGYTTRPRQICYVWRLAGKVKVEIEDKKHPIFRKVVGETNNNNNKPKNKKK